MKQYLLDTAPLTAYFLGRSSAVALIDPWFDESVVYTSVLVYAETIEFIRGRADFVERQQNLMQLLTVIELAPLSFAALDHYSTIRRQLRPPYGPGNIGDIDTLIAATAIVHDLTVVTTDSDFTRVPDLRVLLLRPKTFEPVVPSSV